MWIKSGETGWNGKVKRRLQMRGTIVVVLAGCLALAAFAGCSGSVYVDPDEPDVLGGTGIDSQDVRTVAQEMARSILECDAVASAEKKPVIALIPVTNETAFRIDTDILTLQMRDLLIQNASSKVTFVARERIEDVYAERDAKRAGAVSSNGEKMVSGVDYFLTGVLKPIHKVSGDMRSDYVYYSFELFDSESSEIVWAKGYDVKKVGKRGPAYQ
jgi:PBP1b-binding outer membrane lipoprotein LpoB